MPLAEGDVLPKFSPPADMLGVRRVDPIGTAVAGIGMDLATGIDSPKNFLADAKIGAPVPYVTGALPHFARVFFGHDSSSPVPLTGPSGAFGPSVPFAADMMVNWTIGERGGLDGASVYWDPGSPWYNVFYGAYGVRSHKRLPWGFKDAAGTQPDDIEMLRVPEFDYNYLTAGQLGCPPEKQCFEVTKKTLTQLANGWFRLDVECLIPSGLHTALIPPEIDFRQPGNLGATFQKLRGVLERTATDARALEAALKKATLMYAAYMLIMGLPPGPYRDKVREDYEPVKMAGTMYFKLMKPLITLAWGALCPRTAAGNTLVKHILDVMAPLYSVARA